MPGLKYIFPVGIILIITNILSIYITIRNDDKRKLEVNKSHIKLRFYNYEHFDNPQSWSFQNRNKLEFKEKLKQLYELEHFKELCTIKINEWNYFVESFGNSNLLAICILVGMDILFIVHSIQLLKFDSIIYLIVTAIIILGFGLYFKKNSNSINNETERQLQILNEVENFYIGKYESVDQYQVIDYYKVYNARLCELLDIKQDCIKLSCYRNSCEIMLGIFMLILHSVYIK